MTRVALILLLALAGCERLMADSSPPNPGPARPYCSYQNVPGCAP